MNMIVQRHPGKGHKGRIRQAVSEDEQPLHYETHSIKVGRTITSLLLALSSATLGQTRCKKLDKSRNRMFPIRK